MLPLPYSVGQHLGAGHKGLRGRAVTECTTPAAALQAAVQRKALRELLGAQQQLTMVWMAVMEAQASVCCPFGVCYASRQLHPLGHN